MEGNLSMNSLIWDGFPADLVGNLKVPKYWEANPTNWGAVFDPFSNDNFVELDKSQNLQILNEIYEPSTNALTKAGKHRLQAWVSGWQENLEEYVASGQLRATLPRYFGKYNLIRLRDKLFQTKEPLTEAFILHELIYWCLKFLQTSGTDIRHVAEFGCGTGHNLVFLSQQRELDPLRLSGLEWSSTGVRLLNEYSNKFTSEISGHFFDFNCPKITSFSPGDAFVGMTVASLEQVGENFRPFLEYCLSSGMTHLINIEPIRELMGSHGLSRQSIGYATRRNYLEGYHEYVHNLARTGRIEVLAEYESIFGSKFINGYGIMIIRM